MSESFLSRASCKKTRKRRTQRLQFVAPTPKAREQSTARHSATTSPGCVGRLHRVSGAKPSQTDRLPQGEAAGVTRNGSRTFILRLLSSSPSTVAVSLLLATICFKSLTPRLILVSQQQEHWVIQLQQTAQSDVADCASLSWLQRTLQSSSSRLSNRSSRSRV